MPVTVRLRSVAIDPTILIRQVDLFASHALVEFLQVLYVRHD